MNTKNILEKPFKCDTCGKTFNRKGCLKQHNQVHTGEKLFKCDVCEKAFCRSEYLKIHLRIHTGEKPYKCDVCGKAFNQSQNLLTHLRIHTGEKPYKCNVCGKEFNRSQDLKRHLGIHTGEKPYKCDVCGKGFIQSGNLQSHLVRGHTGEKPYQCDVCGKGFSESGTLQRHLYIHTGKKPYGCDVCGKAFNRSHDLKRHSITHAFSSECHICGEAFRRRVALKEHVKIHNTCLPKGNEALLISGQIPISIDKDLVLEESVLESRDLHQDSTHIEEETFNCDTSVKAFEHPGEHSCLPEVNEAVPVFVQDKNSEDGVFLVKSNNLQGNAVENPVDKREVKLYDSDSLQKHHTDENSTKRFKCGECGKSFHLECTWRSHLFKHSGEKPHKCDICEKVSTYISSLESHRIVHSI